MEPELLTTKQAASVMNIGEERARAILLSRGVQPVSLPWGKERKTLRWSRRAVMTVIDTLQLLRLRWQEFPSADDHSKQQGASSENPQRNFSQNSIWGPSSSGWHGPLCSGAIQYGYQTEERP
ncbi:MAG: hypothetical protein ACLT2T_16500 [Bilophila wadsworthia]